MNGRLERYANGHVVARITLSRRNLMTLLEKLNAARGNGDRTIWRDLEKAFTVAVTAEEDEMHYLGRLPSARGPQPPQHV